MIKTAARVMLAANHTLLFPFVLLFVLDMGFWPLYPIVFICGIVWAFYQTSPLFLWVPFVITFTLFGVYLKNAWANDTYDKKIIIGIIVYVIEILSFLYWNEAGFLPM